MVEVSSRFFHKTKKFLILNFFNDSNEIRENIFEVNCVGFSKKRGV
ncbi:hypothetical protein LBBP_02089 [Leptospira borgpetersenii serovar Ballum]|uniref:Uncharacterized protein n=1 Tax=Leptospira borgpetersenii serovar Ballum TaxID=280505 RepID=A0A0S2IRT1_LEPBO|nr:hypothetical protein LBBP_02089 [Leptospira borgpetersenii serovar Ballum]